jgi:hypothetical protein
VSESPQDDDKSDDLPNDQWWDADDGDDLEPYFLNMTRICSERKLRLFLCGCCRIGWQSIECEAARTALDVAERYADDAASVAELRAAREATYGCRELSYAELTVAAACYPDGWWFDRAVEAQRTMPDMANKQDPFKLYRDLVRCVVGNPFRPVAFDPRWRTADAVGVARGVYDERAFDRLPVLLDALLDAGCDSADVLDHCRSDGPHVRGCWVVDLVLGKA